MVAIAPLKTKISRLVQKCRDKVRFRCLSQYIQSIKKCTCKVLTHEHCILISLWNSKFEKKKGGEAEYHKLVKYDCYMGL